MKRAFFLPPLAAALLALCGCGHLDLVAPGDPDRVLTGSVHFPEDLTLPADAVINVEILDTTHAGPPLVIAEQTIGNPGQSPVPFHVDYTAEDDVLRRGLSIQVRVSFGGRVQYSNSSGSLLTFGDASSPHEIWVQRM